MPLAITAKVMEQTVELHLSGSLDAGTACLLQAELEKMKAAKPARLVLQVRDLEYLGCAGLRTLLFVKQQMGRGVEVHVIAPPRQVRDTLRRAGLHHSFVIEEASTQPPPGGPSPVPPAPAPIALQPLTVPATLDSLEPIGKYVMAAAAAAGLSTDAAYRLRLAVGEIATNVATHGSAGAAAPVTIDLRAAMDAQALRVILEDTGRPFDPHQAPLPEDLDRPAEQRPIGGLGVYLAREGVDGLSYERAGDRNRHVFLMKRPGPAPGA
jgi:anti-anti-sigma factor